MVGLTGTLGLDLEVPEEFYRRLLTETNLSSRPAFLAGIGPFGWVLLSMLGLPVDIGETFDGISPRMA